MIKTINKPQIKLSSLTNIAPKLDSNALSQQSTINHEGLKHYFNVIDQIYVMVDMLADESFIYPNNISKQN
jgi:hypothetical protein